MRIAALAFLCAGESAAHPLAPALLEIRMLDAAHAEVKWQTPMEGIPGGRLRPRLPSSCRPTSEARPVATREPAAAVSWTVECRAGLLGTRIGVDGLDAANTQALLRLVFADGRILQTLLTADAPAIAVPAAIGPRQIATKATELGAHAAFDPRPLLLLVGLVLMAASLRDLTRTLAALFVGASTAIALVALLAVAVPSAPLELALSASLLVPAFTLVGSWRASRFQSAFAALAGLLCGLAFAADVRAADLPAAQLPLILLSFSAGIALAQLCFAAALFVAARLAKTLSLPRWAPRLPAYALGTLAVFWSLQRVTTWLP